MNMKRKTVRAKTHQEVLENFLKDKKFQEDYERELKKLQDYLKEQMSNKEFRKGYAEVLKTGRIRPRKKVSKKRPV